MNAPLTPEREQEIRDWVAAMGAQKDIRYYGSWMQHNELLGEDGSHPEDDESCTHPDGPEWENYRFPVLHCPLWKARS